MALTTIQRELFDGTTTLSAGAPGNLVNISSGTIKQHLAGARTAAVTAPGRCGVIRDADLKTYWSQSISGGTSFMLGGWYRFRAFGSPSCRIMYFRGASTNDVVIVVITIAGLMQVYTAATGFVSTGVTLSLNTDYAIFAAVRHNANNSTDVNVYYQTIGGIFTNAYTLTGVFLGETSLDRLGLINFDSGAGTMWKGHVSAFGYYSMGTYPTDAAMPSDLIDPPTAPQNWYAQSGGVTTNNAGNLAVPWALDFDFLTDEMRYGLREWNTGLGTGEILQINTAGGDLVATVTQGQWNCKGLIVAPTSGTYWRLDCSKTLGAVWSATAGTTNIWETTDGGATDINGAVVWENDVPPGKLNRSDYATEALLLTAMDAKPSGEFWWYPNVAGDKVYVKASGNGNPNSNGKTYTRSRVRVDNDGAVYGGSAILVNTTDVMIAGCYGFKTCLCRSNATANLDNDPGVALVIQFGTASKNCRNANGYFYYWSKHAFDWVTHQSSGTFEEINCQYEQGNCYVATGGQSGTSYYGDTGATGNSVRIRGSKSIKNAMLPNSLLGQVRSDCVAMQDHGDAHVFTSIVGTQLQFPSGTLDQQATDYFRMTNRSKLQHRAMQRCRLRTSARPLLHQR